MNLYAHYPFCRAKCAYCALRSRAGSTPEARRAYCARLAERLAALGPVANVSTVYFGGGSPALCDLTPVFEALGSWGTVPEFTVELHPLDARPDVLEMLRGGGVNRISIGVQSFDDDVLKAMGRLHTAAEAEAAFRAVRAAGFANVGIDLIAGWPGTCAESWRDTLARATALGLDHCSVYTLIREPRTRLDLALRRGELALPSDDVALGQIDVARAALAEAGDGAHGRRGLVRTESGAETTVSPEEDAVERALFSLRTREGLSLERVARLWPVLAPRLPAWRETLEFFKRQGLLQDAYRLTARGAEVCDSILADLL